MGKTLKSRLVAYQANGSKLGLLPEPTSYTVSFTHNAVGALTVSYSRKALRGEILDRRLETGLEIAVEVSDGGRWIEPYNGRFVIASRSRNALDVSDTVSLTGVSYGWLLKKALNLDTSRLETSGDEKGTRKFANANAGTIMRTFMDENWNRGGVKVDCSRFTSGADSAGKQWSYMLPSIYYDLGISIQDVLDSLVNNGLCDWRTDARQLLLWNADSVAVCRDLSKSCVVTLAQDVSEAPDDESIDGLASSILVRGDNINFRQDNPNAPKPWGGWELYSSQQGVNKKETAEHLIKPTLANAARVRGQYTRSVNVVEASCLPLIDYTIGDWITAPTVANREKVRVQQVTLQLDSTGFKASLILNDKNYDSSVRLTKRMNGITGGAHLGGASGAIPAPEKDHRVPKAPQNLSANSDAYINVNGYARGMVTARWDDVTLATDGTTMDITSYAVEYRVNKTGYEWHSAGTTTEHTLSWSNLDCGVQILIRVRAVPSYSDQMGEWSSVFALTVAKDTTPPPVPSKPILSSELGVVSVNWDGKTADGGSMPIDWDRNILGERLTNGSFKEIAAVSTGIGDYVITGLTAGSSHTYAFRAIDHAGNRSDWSAVATVTVASAVSPEEVKQIQKDLADNQTALKDNTAKLDQAQKDIQANKTSLDTANQTLTQAQSDLSQARKDIAQTKSDLTTANGEISKAKESAAQAYAEAHSKNHTFRGPDEPKGNLIVGDLWLKTQKYWTRWKGEKNNSPSMLADFYTYWTGAPNNSPSVLVPLSDRVVEVLTWDGTRFEPFDLVANNILAAGTVAAKHLAVDSVTAEKVKANAITVDKLAANSVTTEKLVADAVTAAKLAANSVQARNIVALSITSDKIAANSVTTAKLRVTEDMMVALLKAHQIQAGDIAANAVTSDNIIANAINSGKIAANAVTSDKIVANAITSDKILANSVTTAKLKVTEDMTVALLKAHQIQAGELAANSVTGQNIKADALYGKTIQGGVFRTSDGRMVINDAGIVAKAKSGRKRQAYYTYWQGEPNNSPSVLVTVDLADDESFVLDSQSGTVAMCGEILSGSTISGTSIVGSEFRTANSRMLLNDSGLVLRNTQGKATVTLNAASGSATFSGTVTGSTITGGTVSGAVITGSAFTSPDGKTKLNSSGFYVGDKLSYDAKSGVLSLKGSIQSGSDLSGVTVTGSTIQTSSTANRGLKLTSGGLVAYDGNGNAKFTLKSDGTIQMNGALLTNGKITAATLEGGTITGGTITGGTIQSSTAANTGFKLSGGALDFYDKSNNRTIHLNGSDNLLSGRFQTALSGPRLELNNTTDSDGSVYGLLKCYDANGVAWYTQGQSRGFNPSGQNDPGAYRRLNIGIDPSNSELSVVRFNSGASRIQMNAGRVDINGEEGWSKHIGGLGIYVNGSRIDPVVYTDLNDWFVPASGWTGYAGDSGKDYRSHMTVIGNTCYMQLELQRSDKKSVTFNAGNYLDIGWFKGGFIPKIGLNVPCVFNNGQYGGAFVPGNTAPSTGDPDINGDGVYLRGHLSVGARQQFTAWWFSVFMMFTI